MRVYRRMRGCGGTGRRTSLRSWRATVGVQIPSSALNGAKPNPVYFFKKVFAVVVNFTRK